jgi:LCP family protein required for cell wall assembly
MHPERTLGANGSARPATLTRARTSLLILALALVTAACGQAPAPAASARLAPTAAATPTASLAPTPTPLPTPVPLDQRLLGSRFTVLIVGEDQSAARRARGYRGDNTDAIMMVSISPDQKRVAMISLPRDTVDVPLGNGQIWRSKVNAIANAYGIDALRVAIASLFGIHIQYYVKVNMDDFVDLVDAVGGVGVDVKTVVQEPRWNLYLTPGPVHLNGRQALYYTRARHFDSDYARAARQQQVVHALARKYTNPKTKIDILKVMGTLSGLETNLPLDQLATLLVLARRAARADYTAQVLTPPQFALDWGDQGDGRGWVIIPNVAAMQAQVRYLLRN